MIPDPEDLDYLRHRVALVFERYDILPFYGIQYRLTEVGPHRFDPKGLKTSLRALGDIRSEEGFYVSPELTRQRRSARIAQTNVCVGRLAAIESPLESIATTIAKELRVDDRLEINGKVGSTDDNDELYAQRPSVILGSGRSATGRSIYWVTHELPWIYPDDPRLWKLIAVAAREQRCPMIIARKVAPATFAICKALGAIALQYYLPVGIDVTDELIIEAESIGWPKIIESEDFASHPVIDQLVNHESVEQTRALTIRGGAAQKAIRIAEESGFMSSDAIRPPALLAWANASQLQLPPQWYRAVSKWPEWELPAGRAEIRLNTKNNDLARLRNEQARRPSRIRGPRISADVDAETFDRLCARAASKEEPL